MQIDSLKKRYAIKLLANIVFGIVNALMVAIIPKTLGPVAYGQFNFLQQFYNQFISFIDANSSTAFFTKLSANNNRKELIVFYFFASLVLFSIALFFTFLVNILSGTDLIFPDIKFSNVYLGMIFGFLTWLVQVYIKISDAFAVTVNIEIVKILHKVLTFITVLFIINYVHLSLDVYLYFNIISLAVLVVLLHIILMQKGVFDRIPSYKDVDLKLILNEFYLFCSPLFVFNLIAIAVGIFDIWLLQKVSGSVEVGFYGLAYSISAMCFLFTSAMTPIIMREFSQSIEKQDFENVKKLFSRYVPMLYAISAYFSVFIAFHAADLLLIFTDERFKAAYIALVIMAFYPLHQTYGQINAALFFSAEKVTIYRNIGNFFSFFGLCLSFLFIYLFEMGAEGMAWKMLIVQIISANVQLIFNARYIGVNASGFIFHQVISVFVLSIIAFFTKLVVSDNMIFNFIASGFVYTVCVFVLSILFPNLLCLFDKNLRNRIIKLD